MSYYYYIVKRQQRSHLICCAKCRCAFSLVCYNKYMKVNSLLLIAKDAFEERVVSCCAYDQIMQTISLCYGRSWWKIVRTHQVCYE